MTGAEYYTADPLVFDEIRQRIERVLRTDIRLPEWPFRAPTGNADICQFYESVSGTFGPVLDALAAAHGDTSISLVVFDPTPTYYRKHYGSYSGFTMPSENIAERYWDAISYDPRDDPGGSLTNTANTLGITGSSGAWAVWAERAWDLVIVLSQRAGGPWLLDDVNFAPVEEALEGYTEPERRGPLRARDRTMFLDNVRSRGTLPRT